MIMNFLRRIFGSANDRLLNKYRPLVEQINAKENEVSALSDDELKARTAWLKERLSNGESLNDILVDAFATVREAAKRVMNMRHFDVQILGGIILHNGMVAEMKTGEGKTLVATCPVYLNALLGKGVHVVTVNDYLASRDAEWMGKVYNFLGLSVGVVVSNITDEERKQAYEADITYGTNNEFGFDYLRDNMKFRIEDMVQRGHHFAIVDEVDNILIDEARTPLIISGPSEDSSDLYVKVDKIIPRLIDEDYEVDEKSNNVTLTEKGNIHVEDLVRSAGLIESGSLYDIQNIKLVHHINQALKAHKLFKKDKDYIVKDGEIIIIDEFTGRMSEGRRFSDGLHQALEAKEGVEVQVENQTLASVTYQNYFRMYDKLSGMTGTAETDAAELTEIYNLGVAVLPTNKPLRRKDYDDEIYRTAREKYNVIIKLIKECVERKQPVLVGTTSIEKSEYISGLLSNEGIEHNVLNARYHEQEAEIIAQAGVPGAVTIATNMAGRGTDIKLGGNLEYRIKKEVSDDLSAAERDKLIQKITKEIEENEKIVLEAGGLYIIGTERHESRRIDNQLRGRAGRQGDVGASKFFLSLEDDLMRIFGSDRLGAVLSKLGMEEGEAITHPMVNRALEKAQTKIEARNFDIRKQLLKFDDVMNEQRKVIYKRRKEIMASDDLSDAIGDMRIEAVEDIVFTAIPENSYVDQWDIKHIHEETMRIFALDLPVKDWANEEGIAEDEIIERILSAVEDDYKSREQQIDSEIMRKIEKTVYLQVLDQVWKEHLLNLDHLRQGIHLRAYGQRDPLNEYKAEAFQEFERMLIRIRDNTLQTLSMLRPANDVSSDDVDGLLQHDESNYNETTDGFDSIDKVAEYRVMPMDSHNTVPGGDIPRNAPCPCGSNKRYKHCCGRR